MIEINTFSLGEPYDYSIIGHSTNNNNFFDANIIMNYYFNYNHYFCINCNKFPFIKFCKDRKNIRFTCSCFNNKKILIEEFLKIFFIEDNLLIFISKINLYINIKDKLICKDHKKKFKGFSKIFLNNYCEDCYEYKNGIRDNDVIKFDGIRIEENKIKELIEKINDNKDISEEISEEISYNIKFINKYMLLSKDEYKSFKILIYIIINDYKNYPNFIHHSNIKNLLYFFNIEEESIEKEKNIMNDNLFENNEPIIIEYINNISNKTKLFSKIFVKNNKNKCNIEIEGKRLDLIEKYEFKTKERKIRVKLFINKNVFGINIYKMFANCINLIYVNGISKINRNININKIFYNCISLSSIPDFKDWKIKKYNGYLIFFNCISLVFFPNETELNINKYDEGFLGILITKYLKYNKEIIISNINEDKEGYINLFKNRIKIEDKNKEIIILDGKDNDRELIACYKYKEKEEKEDKDKLIELYKNENIDGNEIKIKLRIIYKMKDMKEIIERKELELTKWNINNVTNMKYLFSGCKNLSSSYAISKWNIKNVTNISYLFYGCKSLLCLPDISNWNINNVTNMAGLFYGCTSLLYLPDISNWNTINVTSIADLFYGCKSLLFLPDISKWNINNVTNISHLFYSCESLSYLPDISKWNINNVTNMSGLFSGCTSLLYLPNISNWNTINVTSMAYLFYGCKSLSLLPDISKWNINNVTNISYLFYSCESLSYLPDISKWNINNVTNMTGLFYGCASLLCLPDISNWNTNNVTAMAYLFYGCRSLSFLPDISKWNINNVTNMESLFDLCISLLSISDKFKFNIN